MKKKIIFVISRMAIGGAQMSLVNALKEIDFTRYEVNLYVRDNQTALLSEVPDEVRVIVNQNKSRYDYYPVALAFGGLKRLSRLFKNKKLERLWDEKCTAYIVRKKTDYESKRHPELREAYDIAISYLQGYTCKFTADCIHAGRLICFYHNSTDSLPQLHKEYLPRFDHIVTVTEEARQILQKQYPTITDKFIVIPNLVGIESIRRKACAFRIDRKPNRLILCTCGRISREKGYDLAVKAAKLLKEKGLRFTWYFVGSGPLLEQIQQQVISDGLTGNIVLVGSQRNPYPWMADCDIYVQPSYEEAQPLTIMEAQILQKPIVSTDTVGGRSLIRHSCDGYITAIDSESLASGIAFLAEHKTEREKYIANLSDDHYTFYNDDVKRRWHYLLEG